MAKETIPFSAFVEAAGAQHTEFVTDLHDYMLAKGCSFEIKEAKSGYVVSYLYAPDKRTVANYVFRKKGPMLRVYADNVSGYMEMLDRWPESMKAAVKKASPCKRMLAPDTCNPRCVRGFDFLLDGERQQKCRFGAFAFFLDGETKPCLRTMVEREMEIRTAQ